MSLVGLACAIALVACGKEIDPGATHAGLVGGTDGLYRFCDGSTLIYFTDIDGSDDIVEAVWPGLCAFADGVWTYDLSKDAPENGNAPDGDR